MYGINNIVLNLPGSTIHNSGININIYKKRPYKRNVDSLPSTAMIARGPGQPIINKKERSILYDDGEVGRWGGAP